MHKNQSSYRQIMKSTSLFGGVQLINILISIIKSKITAILLGTTGIGISGLLTSTTGFIEGITNFGLGTSAVKNVAAAHATGDSLRVSIVVKVLRRLVWITGILGLIITLSFSSFLSEITFGNKDYTYAFIFISVTLLLNQISTGQSVVLRGMRQLKFMAKSSVLGSILGLIITLPLYYLYGLNGIVPGIIATSIITFAFTWYFANKVKIQKVDISKATTIEEGKDMLKMGFMLSLGSIITLSTSYLLKIFISNLGGIDHVGLYTAGFAITESYVGMIFTAMGTDYYPRLSVISSETNKINLLVTQQANIAILILSPLIVSFLVFAPLIIQILYSKNFLPITSMVTWAILGMFFRATSWAIGYILVIKSDSSLFIKTSFGFSFIFLINNIIGYKLWGLTGLGISFFINYVIHFAVMVLITRHYYQFKFEKGFYSTFLFGFIFCILGIAVTFFSNSFVRYFIGVAIIIATSIFSFREINRKLNLDDSFKRLKLK